MEWTKLGGVLLSARGARRWALAACILACAACGTQASDEYLGEPLLSMQGQAKVQALTGGGQPIVPALCFSGPLARYPKLLTDNVDLPPGEPPFEIDLPVGRGTVTDNLVHIVDIESQGEFPAKFNVDVYVPPPDSALSRLLSGEPRMATGFICAVYKDHAAVAHHVDRFSTSTMQCEGVAPGNPNPGPCKKQFISFVVDSSRFYVETYVCPTWLSKASECAMQSVGDPALKYEIFAETIVGVADDPLVVYLADPAPAGSYTAWLLGAAEGVSAGYHLFRDAGHLFTGPLYYVENYLKTTPSDVVNDCGIDGDPPGNCGMCSERLAMAELQQRYGDQYQILASDFPVYYPGYEEYDWTPEYLPDEVTEEGWQTIARKQIEICEMPKPKEVSSGVLHELSIEINQVDPSMDSEDPAFNDPTAISP